MSLDNYRHKMEMHTHELEEFDKSTLSIGEELRNDPEIKEFLDKVYEEHNNNINGFNLPRQVNCSKEYFKAAQEMLDDFVRQIDSPAFNSQPGLKTEVERTCKQLKDALKCAQSYDIEQLDKVLQKAIQNRFNDDFFISELDKSYAFRGLAPFENMHSRGLGTNYDEMNTHDIEFFRARVSKDPITQRGEMVNLPYKLRSLSYDARFSSKDQVCLYLGATTYVCKKECQKDEKANPDDLYMSCFKPNEKGKKLRILNLVVSDCLINGMAKNRDIQNKLLKSFPFVIVTSFRIINPDAIRYEYLISQRLIKILRNLGIDGAAYLSCQGESALQYPHGVNLALPVYDICEEDQYGEICKCFSMTEPFQVNKLLQIDNPLKSTFINDIYTKKSAECGNIMSNVTYDGKDIFYGDTLFSRWDDCLINKQFTDFKE